MNTLFECTKDNEIQPIGKGFGIKIISELEFNLYLKSQIHSRITLKTKYDKRIWICQFVVENQLVKSKMAGAFNIDEKTLRMWLSVYEEEGAEGLRNCTKTGVGRRTSEANRPDVPLSERSKNYNKKKQEQAKLSADALEEKFTHQNLLLNFEAADEVESDLYSGEYQWGDNRYGGSFLYLAMIEHNYKALRLFHWFMGDNAMVMVLFIVMQVMELPSIESLKTEYKTELGRILGIKQLYSFPVLWKKIHETVDMKVSKSLRLMLFKTQITNGLVSLWYLFIDGHFVPYTGKSKVHKNFHTQSREMHPGQNEIYIHDHNGKIVYFDIQEGKGDMFGVIKEKGKEYAAVFNDIDYGLYQTQKTYRDNQGNSIDLKRIIVWNTKTNVRSAVVSNDPYENLEMLSIAMLNRWGKSENSFKYMNKRFDMHYNPVLNITELSENQEVNNPEYIKLKQKIQKLKSEISTNEKTIGKKKLVFNKDKTLRKNKSRDRLIAENQTKKEQIEQLKQQLDTCIKRITTNEIKDCKPFKKIATEGKNLWNITTTLVWNSRKEMEKILGEFIPNKRDRLPVLDAITKCRSRIKSTKYNIIVQFEPLERPAFYQAQVQFVNKMNLKSGYLFNQKKLHFEVAKKNKIR